MCSPVWVTTAVYCSILLIVKDCTILHLQYTVKSKALLSYCINSGRLFLLTLSVKLKCSLQKVLDSPGCLPPSNHHKGPSKGTNSAIDWSVAQSDFSLLACWSLRRQTGSRKANSKGLNSMTSPGSQTKRPTEGRAVKEAWLDGRGLT